MSLWSGGAFMPFSKRKRDPEGSRPRWREEKSGGRIPHDDAGIGRYGMHYPEAPKIVPGHATAAAVVVRDLAAHLFGGGDGLRHDIRAEEDSLVGLGVGPGRRGLVGLLDAAYALVAADLAVLDHLEAGIRVAVQRLQAVLEGAEGARTRDAEVILVHVGRNVPLL